MSRGNHITYFGIETKHVKHLEPIFVQGFEQTPNVEVLAGAATMALELAKFAYINDTLNQPGADFSRRAAFLHDKTEDFITSIVERGKLPAIKLHPTENDLLDEEVVLIAVLAAIMQRGHNTELLLKGVSRQFKTCRFLSHFAFVSFTEFINISPIRCAQELYDDVLLSLKWHKRHSITQELIDLHIETNEDSFSKIATEYLQQKWDNGLLVIGKYPIEGNTPLSFAVVLPNSVLR